MDQHWKKIVVIIFHFIIAAIFLPILKKIYHQGVEDGYYSVLDELVGDIREHDAQISSNSKQLWIFDKTHYVQ